MKTSLILIVGFYLFIGYILYFLVSSIVIPMVVVRNPLSQNSNNYYFNPITKNIFYSPMGNWFSLGYEQIHGVKNNSEIKLLLNELLVTNDFVVLEGNKLSFKPHEDFNWMPPYLKNNGKVYFYKGYGNTVELSNVDPSSFQTIHLFGFAKDLKNAFYRSKTIAIADSPTFSVHSKNPSLSLDKNNFYFTYEDPDDNSDKYKIVAIAHNGNVVNTDLDFLFDSQFVYFFDYKSLKIRKEPYQDISHVRYLPEGIQIDERIIPRSEYLN